MFWETLKTMRERAGYTQQELADAVGISRGSISMYELGKREPDYATLREIARVLNTSRAELLGDEDHEEKPEPMQYPTELQRKYMALDEHGRNLVDFILDSEYKRCAKAARSRGADYD